MLKGPIAKATIRTSWVLGLRLVLQACTLILLAKIFGPDDFGIYAGLGALAVLMGTLASFGTHLALLRDVSRFRLDVDEALRLALGTTVFFGATLFALYIIFSQFLLKTPNNIFLIVFCFGCAEMLFQPLLVIAAMERHGKGLIARSQILLTQPLILRLIIVLAITWSMPVYPLYWYAVGHLLVVIFPLIYVFYCSSGTWRQPSQWRIARLSELGGLAGYAVMNTSANGVAELDKMLSLRLLSSNEAGIYSSASRIVSSLTLPVIAMMLSAMPRLFRDQSVAGKKLQWWLIICAGSYGVFASVVMLFSAPWIEMVLGYQYTGTSEVIALLAFAVPAISIRAAATNIMTTLERPWTRVCLELTGWLTIVVLAYILTSFNGSLGLVLAIIGAEWLLAIISILLINFMSASELTATESSSNE